VPRTKPKPAYTQTQKTLHWAVVVLVALQYFAFDHIGRAFDDLMESDIAGYGPVVVGHLACGVAILLLMLARLLLRLARPAPALPRGTPLLMARLAKLGHWAMYVLLVALPLLGLAAWFGEAGVAATLHEAGTTLLEIVVILHILAAMLHQFWLRDGLLRRML